MSNESPREPWKTPRIVVRIDERPVFGGGCSDNDRRWFRRTAVRPLQEEFGDSVELDWKEAPRGSSTFPVTYLNERQIYAGGFLPYECLRPTVANALAMEWAVLQDSVAARAKMEEEGIPADDWQDALLNLAMKGGCGPGPDAEDSDGSRADDLGAGDPNADHLRPDDRGDEGKDGDDGRDGEDDDPSEGSFS